MDDVNSDYPGDWREDRAALLRLLAQIALREGKFRLSSGGESDYYLDCRVVTLHPLGGRLAARLFLRELLALTPPPEGVGGLTLGADPIVAGVAIASALGPQPMPGFLVRKAEKTHGTGRRIEGLDNLRPGARVAIVDDVCTTAASTMQAAEAAWEAGFEIVAVRCLVEREEAGGRANLDALWQQRLGRPCPFGALFGASEIRAARAAADRAGAAS